MIIDTENSNYIIADKDKVFRRKSNKTIQGDEVYLTEVVTNGCQILDTPITFTVDDFEEIDKPIHHDDETKEVVGKPCLIRQDNDNDF